MTRSWKKWTQEEINLLSKVYPNSPNKNYLVKTFNRNYGTIKSKAKELGIRSEIFWSKEEIEQLKKDFRILTEQQLKEKYQTSMMAINKKAKFLGLTPRAFWSSEEIEIIKRDYPTCNTFELAKKVNKSYEALHNKANSLGLKRQGHNKGINLGKNNNQWSGDEVGYAGVHEWVNRHKPKPEFCEECGKIPPKDLANISQEYHRDINDFRWLCRKCHMLSDGRLEKFRIFASKRLKACHGKITKKIPKAI